MSLDIINEFFSQWPLVLSTVLLVITIFPQVSMLVINLYLLSTVFTHLSSLDVKKSTGSDQLSSRFLKEVASEIVVPLTNLFNYVFIKI